MKELVVISGKGGTGKTSIVGSFAVLACNKVLADCDVDAADLHLILQPSVGHRGSFSGSKKASIVETLCTQCGRCAELCRFDAISSDGGYKVDPIACEGCGVCVRFCPEEAITFEVCESGHWFISHTRYGPMVHAELGIAEENSGKLVTLVRQKARQLAEQEDFGLIIVDGPPGIGCPVIASLGGATLALIVTEPSLSALHDLERARRLTAHFGIETAVCINKSDLNDELTECIVRRATELNSPVLQAVRYDCAVTKAQMQNKAVVEYTDKGASEDIASLWQAVSEHLQESK